jgi:hypothetical protein
LLGYALTAVCVPLLAVTPALGGAGLTVAAALILAERLGKAIRSPAKSALLADAAEHVGMGRGLGVHKALDQIGAFAGPLLVAALVAYGAGGLSLPLAVLAVPGAASILLLMLLRARSRSRDEPVPSAVADLASAAAAPARVRLPAQFWWFATAAGLCTAGLVTYGLIGVIRLRWANCSLVRLNHEVVTSTPVVALWSVMTPVRACTASSPTRPVHRFACGSAAERCSRAVASLARPW